MKLLLDQNVVIDYIAERGAFAKDATKIFALGYLNEFELWLSVSQITDVYYIISSSLKALSRTETAKELRRLREFVHICSLDESNIDAALDSSWPDFEDACVYEAARKVKADAIITRNAKDFGKSSVKVFTPTEFFEWLEKDKGLVYDFAGL